MLTDGSIEDVAQVLEGVAAALPRRHIAEALATLGSVAEALDDAVGDSDAPYIAEAAAALDAARRSAQRARASLELGAYSLDNYIQSITGPGGYDAPVPLKQSLYGAVLAPESTLINVQTAEHASAAIDALLPAAEANSSRKCIEILQEWPDTVLCELLRRDVPLADHVLVDRHINLVLDRAWKIVRHHPNQSLEVHELLGAGIEGYLVGCRRYADGNKAKLTTFASDFAYFAMLKVADTESTTVSIPYVFRQTVIHKVGKIDNARLNDGEAPLTDQEISELFGLPLDATDGSAKQKRTVKDVRNAQRLLYGVRSLGAGGVSLTDFTSNIERSLTEDSRQHDTAWEAIRNVMQEKLKKEVEAVLSTLEEREAAVVRMHFGMDGPALSLAQIGKKIDCSAGNVHLIEKAALAKIRHTSPHLVMFWKQSIEEA